jgi:hypothetical protein
MVTPSIGSSLALVSLWSDEVGARIVNLDRVDLSSPFEHVGASIALDLPCAPSLCASPDERVFAAWRDDDGRVWVSSLTAAGLGEARVVEGAKTDHPPALAWWHGTLCVAITGRDEHLYLARAAEGAKLRFRRAHDDALSAEAPALAATPARLELAFVGTDRCVYLANSDDGARIAFERVEMAGEARSAPALAAWGDTLHLVVVDGDGYPRHACSRDGPKLRLVRRSGEAVTDDALAFAAFEDGVFAALTGTDGQLYTAFAAHGDALFFGVDELAGSLRGATQVAGRRVGEPLEPSRSRVVPVLYFPRDLPVDEALVERSCEGVAAHLALAQTRYRRWLETDTFAFTEATVVRGGVDHRSLRDRLWEIVADDVYRALGDNTATTTAVYLVLVARPPGFEDELWLGAGGPETAEGAGMVILDLRSLHEDVPYPFQSTLVHELGHGFGLPHVDAWGESMDACESVMSYNPRHHTVGLSAPEPDGAFLPEEYALLGRNEVAFPRFEYVARRHNPSGRTLRRADE